MRARDDLRGLAQKGQVRVLDRGAGLDNMTHACFLSGLRTEPFALTLQDFFPEGKYFAC